MDYDGYGFFINPGLVNIGQNFYVVNTAGGHEGLREIKLNYLNVPVAFKLHMIDLAFFKLSVVAGAGFGFLLDGNETIRHTATKLIFPAEVELPAGYVEVYDGVLVPEVTDYSMLSKSDFKSYQIFALLGFRSDWDVSDNWRVSADFRLNYGLFDPRTDQYINKLNDYQTLYDVPGKRRDLFVQLGISLSRYIEIKKKETDQRKKFKGQSPRRRKPKG